MFYFSEYKIFDEKTPVEDLDEIVSNRRLLVTKIMNESIRAKHGENYVPLNIPDTKFDELDEAHSEGTFVMESDDGRDRMTLKQVSKEEDKTNENDFLLNVPFGFIHDGKVYILAVATLDGK